MHAAADVAPVSILEPPRDGLSQERIDAAAALVQDAQHGRQIHRKSGARHLRLYGLFHSRKYKLYIVMVGIINLGLALFEPSARAVPQYVCHTCAAVEFATLVLYSADVLFESRIHVNHFWMRSNWTRAKLFILTASFIDMSISLATGVPIRVMRVARPFLFLDKFRQGRRIFSACVKAVPPIANVVLLLAFHVVLSAFLGRVFLRQLLLDAESGDLPSNTRSCSPFLHTGCDDFFDTMPNAVWQLFILLTSVNFPDVMLPFFRASRYSAVFFVIYLFVGRLFLLNLVLAVAYEQYRLRVSVSHKKIMRRRGHALMRAFSLLDDRHCGFIDFPTWRRLLLRVRPKLDEQVAWIMFRAIDRDDSGTISRREFLSLCNFLHVRAERGRPLYEVLSGVGSPRTAAGAGAAPGGPPSPDLAARAPPTPRTAQHRQRDRAAKLDERLRDVAALQFPSQQELRREMRRQVAERCSGLAHAVDVWTLQWAALGRMSAAARTVAQAWIAAGQWSVSKTGELVWDLLVLLNTVLLLIQIGDREESALTHVLDVVILALVGIFVVEMCLKVTAMGPKRFWQGAVFNRIDSVCIAISLLSAGAERALGFSIHSLDDRAYPTAKVFIALRLLRSIRLLRGIASILISSARLLVPMTRFGVVLLSAFYAFAIVGNDTFAHQLTPSNPAVAASAYGVDNYYALNFNSLPRATVSLYYLLVVNNWPVLADGCEAAVGKWSRLYFLAWYLVAVTVILNVFVAFLIDVYLLAAAAQRRYYRGELEPWERSMRDAMNQVAREFAQSRRTSARQYVTHVWRFRKKWKLALLYNDLFGEEEK